MKKWQQVVYGIAHQSTAQCSRYESNIVEVSPRLVRRVYHWERHLARLSDMAARHEPVSEGAGVVEEMLSMTYGERPDYEELSGLARTAKDDRMCPFCASVNTDLYIDDTDAPVWEHFCRHCPQCLRWLAWSIRADGDGLAVMLDTGAWDCHKTRRGNVEAGHRWPLNTRPAGGRRR